VQRELDHAALRQYKAAALHLQLSFYPPEQTGSIGLGAPGRRQTLPEIVSEFLKRRPLPERLSRDQFVALGLELLEEPADADGAA